MSALFDASEATRSLTQGFAPPSMESTAKASFWERIGGQIGMVSWTWIQGGKMEGNFWGKLSSMCKVTK